MPVLSLMYSEIAHQSVGVFVFLIPCIIPFSMTYIFGTLLTANGNLRVLNITSAIAIVVNVVINFTLIPLLEARGAAIASLSTQTSIAVMQFFIAFKLLKIPFSILPFFRCLIYICLLKSSVYLATCYLPVGFIPSLLICSGVALILAFATKLIPLRFIVSLFEKA
jgi:O-antigen/teichoic acid export membrane protein